ncbi:MAG: cytochrome-c peroxidase [Planctomycetota bacterium]
MQHATTRLFTLLLFAGASIAQETAANERVLGSEHGFRIVLPAESHRYAEPTQRFRRRRGPGPRDSTPNDNPVTDAGATLGRVLFYDKRLSVTKTVACASCHRQEHAFADPSRLSTGIRSRRGKRNSPSLVNVRDHATGGFFWDARAKSLEEQVLVPIQDRLEMGMKLPALIERLDKLPEYQVLFREAFGDGGTSETRIAQALAQFVRTLTSSGSRFDEGYRQAGSVDGDFANFREQENLGKRIFFGRGRGPSCASCHARVPRGRRGRGVRGDLFVASRPRNIGLDRDSRKDRGVGAVTGRPEDDGKFKAPSLRNVEVTGPYMHDGRFQTLEQVVAHYATGVQAHPNVDRRLAGRGFGGRGFGRRGSQPRGIDLDKQEQLALVAFLKTLTDRTFLEDERFSSPFR